MQSSESLALMVSTWISLIAPPDSIRGRFALGIPATIFPDQGGWSKGIILRKPMQPASVLDAPPRPGAVRMAELMGAFSIASDLAFGYQLEDSIRSCYVAMRLAEAMKLPEAEQRTVFYTALLKDAGCTCYTSQLASFWAMDEIQARKDVLVYGEGASALAYIAWVRNNVAAEQPLKARLGHYANVFMRTPKVMADGFATSCEVAVRVATRLGMPPDIQDAVLNLWEQWDGKGFPSGRRGEELPISARVVQVSFIAVPIYRRYGKDGVAEFTRSQSGRFLDPAVAEAFSEIAGEDDFWAGVESNAIWADVLALEPESDLTWVSESKLDDLSLAMADYIDLKSPYVAAHSRRVARISEQIATLLGATAAEIALTRRAALSHDLGLVGVPSYTLNRPPDQLSRTEQEQMRLHPYHAERLLAAVPIVAPWAALVGAHEEHVDGSGYFRGLKGRDIPLGARIIAVADRVDELTHDAPGQPAMELTAAVDVLAAEAGTRLDEEVVAAVRRCLGAGAAPARTPAELPAGLTTREVEVLRLASQGLTRRQIGQRLSITENTVRHHLEHIYGKTETKTRVAATLFAMEHDLLP
ncbi:MAG: HD domain-containing protein [Dehalococcoidia bacterium]|nr:HD domain-containing protein [Dehalococcoidia bacterium]